MKKLTFQLHHDYVEFGAGVKKYLLGSNQLKKQIIPTLMNMYINKLDDSDYSEDNNLKNYIKVDDNEITKRNTNLFIIHPYINFNEELKLKRNSVLKRYLEVKLKDIELDEEYTTLSILFQDFSEVINSYVNSINKDINFDIQLPELTIKQILKLVEPRILKDEISIHFDELKINEKMTLWIEMLSTIAKDNLNKTHICYIKMVKTNEDIISQLNKLNSPNLIILIDTTPPVNINLEHIVYLKDEVIDFADDNQIYEKITLQHSDLIDLKTTKTELKSYIKEQKTAKIEAIL
ncbi:MAG: hypothetical protein UMR38_02935 [Candidatus Izemoplasma sp.]|nr:hypothetical protein [Candidatus Izemoplasma sp.]